VKPNPLFLLLLPPYVLHMQRDQSSPNVKKNSVPLFGRKKKKTRFIQLRIIIKFQEEKKATRTNLKGNFNTLHQMNYFLT
jgi:thiosulfate reductase cytochrome b subunit